MRNFILPIVSLATVCVGLYGQAAGSSGLCPQATRLEPKVAKPGTVLTITGMALGKTRVEEVYLTDHRFDMKVKVLEQTDQTLKIRVPPFLKAGRQQLLFLTTGQNQAFLEQPVYVVVELEEDVAKTDNPKADPPPTAGDKTNNNHPDKQDQ